HVPLEVEAAVRADALLEARDRVVPAREPAREPVRVPPLRRVGIGVDRHVRRRARRRELRARRDGARRPAAAGRRERGREEDDEKGRLHAWIVGRRGPDFNAPFGRSSDPADLQSARMPATEDPRTQDAGAARRGGELLTTISGLDVDPLYSPENVD